MSRLITVAALVAATSCAIAASTQADGVNPAQLAFEGCHLDGAVRADRRRRLRVLVALLMTWAALGHKHLGWFERGDGR